MSASTREVLDRLNRQIQVHVHSTAALTADVGKAAGAIDRQRAKKRGELEPPARKPGVGPLHRLESGDLETTPWELISVFAKASTLARQGRGRGLAEHWQALKYCQALGAGAHGHLALTEEGQIPELAYRGMQARELGRALGLAVAERTVRNRFPDHMVSVLDAELVLLAGFARSGPRPTLGARPRPDFFLEVWRPGEPSRVFVVTVNGNHQVATKRTGRTDRSAFKQLARASERAEQFHLAEWNSTPCLMMSTELMAKDGITVNVLQAPGEGLLPLRPASGRESADVTLSKRNPPYASAVTVPAASGRKERVQDGFLIPSKNLRWYGQLLARTAAASQLALAGASTEAAQYLTEDQGRKHYSERTFAGSSSVRDACHKLASIRYLGTDQVFRLGGTRVEAFSGVDQELYQLLVEGEVEAYRQRAYEKRATFPTSSDAPEWGPISFCDDGTVVALRILPQS